MFAANAAVGVDVHYEKNPALKKEDVQALKEWTTSHLHLPQINEEKLLMFLTSCYFDMDAAKTCIRNYYEMKEKWPEFFAQRDVRAPTLKRQLQVTSHALLPNTTPEGYLICLWRLLDTDAANFIYVEQLKIFDMCASLWIKQVRTSEGQVCILDLTGFNFWHVTKVSLGTARKFLTYVQEALPARVKGIHVINASIFIEKFADVIKRFMKSELLDNLHVHRTMRTFYEFVPRELLPEEYGGENGCLKDLEEQLLRDLFENAEFFVEEERNERAGLKGRIQEGWGV